MENLIVTVPISAERQKWKVKFKKTLVCYKILNFNRKKYFPSVFFRSQFWSKKVQANAVWREGHRMNIEYLQHWEKVATKTVGNFCGTPRIWTIVFKWWTVYHVYKWYMVGVIMKGPCHSSYTIFLSSSPPLPHPLRHAHYADGVKISWFFRLSQREMLLLTGVRDLVKGQSSEKEPLNINIWLCWWKWDGWRGRGR